MGLGVLRAAGQGYNYNYNYNYEELVSKMELGLGWLRTVARNYNYSRHQNKFANSLHGNSKSLGIKLTGAWMAARGGARLQLQLK